MTTTVVGPVENIAPGLPGGISAALNVTAVGAIKAGPGVLVRIIPIVLGTGTLTLNDMLAAGTPSAANEIDSLPVASMTVGIPVWLEWPCGTGIYVSAIPSGGQYNFSFS